MATTFKVSDALPRELEYKMLSLLGVNRNIKWEHRTIPQAFSGVGLFSLPIEQTICVINMVVQHFGVL